VRDPSVIVRAGQIVKVKVLSMDPKTKRITLSIKAMQDPPAKPQQKPRPKPQLTLEEQLAVLSSKWKTH
jgi:protein Tex